MNKGSLEEDVDIIFYREIKLFEVEVIIDIFTFLMTYAN